MKNEGYDFKVKVHLFFSETRFANHVSKVYKHFKEEFPALVRTLEEAKEQNRDGTQHGKEKATKADQLQSRIYNITFVLSLSLLCDIYAVYAIAANLL